MQFIHHLKIYFLSLLLLLTGLLSCQSGPNQVTIKVDGETIVLSTEATTVRSALREAAIDIGDLDRVKPDLNYQLQSGVSIEVIRVIEKFETMTNTISYEQQRIFNEALAPGEQRLAQLGVNGVEEIVTRIIYENGVEVMRVPDSRTILQPVVPEILVIGREKENSSVPIEGTLVYLSGGNAWLIKNNSATRRPLTKSGDLDGRVFSLSPDGTALLYSRTVTETLDAPLNELWTINTLIVGEKPRPISVTGVLYAAWSPVITQQVIAYSTAERTASQPGWRANNDLWIWNTLSETTTAKQIIPPNTSSLYAWWGLNYAWSPDGKLMAYSSADEVGVINLTTGLKKPLQTFVPYQTNGDWVWVPMLSWSPDSRFITTVLHGPPINDETPENSPRFDLWLLAADGRFAVLAESEVGIWSNPLWHTEGIIYGQADLPYQSINSLYRLMTMDRDGSNSRQIFSSDEAAEALRWRTHFPDFAMQASDILFVYKNNLYLFSPEQAFPQPLTTDGQSQKARWIIPPPLDSTQKQTKGTLPVTITEKLTTSGKIIIQPTRSPP